MGNKGKIITPTPDNPTPQHVDEPISPSAPGAKAPPKQAEPTLPPNRCELSVDPEHGGVMATGYVKGKPVFQGKDFVEPGLIGNLRRELDLYNIPSKPVDMVGNSHETGKKYDNPRMAPRTDWPYKSYRERGAQIETGDSGKLTCTFRDAHNFSSAPLPVTTPWPSSSPKEDSKPPGP